MTKRQKEKLKEKLIIPFVLILLIIVKNKSFLKRFIHNKIDETKVTITEFEAANIANNLQKAMQGLGTDFETIKLLLTKLNVFDVQLVSNKFGLRSYDTNMFYNILYGSKMDLVEWFKSELSGSDLEFVKNKFDGTGLWR